MVFHGNNQLSHSHGGYKIDLHITFYSLNYGKNCHTELVYLESQLRISITTQLKK